MKPFGGKFINCHLILTQNIRNTERNRVILFTLDGVWIRELDLLTTYTHHSELHVTTALPLISTLYKSPQHPLSLFPTRCVCISRFLVTALTMEILQLRAFRLYLRSLPCRTQLSTNWQPTAPEKRAREKKETGEVVRDITFWTRE
jgi:hypothetical protein